MSEVHGFYYQVAMAVTPADETVQDRALPGQVEDAKSVPEDITIMLTVTETILKETLPDPPPPHGVSVAVLDRL